MCGYLGAGKTTFARRLEQESSAIRFTHDEWIVRIFGRIPSVLFEDHFERVSSVINSIWPRCTELGVDVVLDHGFWHRRQREEARRVALALGASVRLYYLYCDDNIAWRRVDARNHVGDPNLVIGRDLFENLRGRFEAPQLDEGAVEIAT
jgi:predicted kinase